MSDQPGCLCSICEEDAEQRQSGVTSQHMSANNDSNQSDSSDSVGRSADLRTRIAAALAHAECEDRCGTTFEARPCLGCLERCIPQADAVIRELGLRQELRYPNRLPHYTFMPPQRTRYVTGWENCDE